MFQTRTRLFKVSATNNLVPSLETDEGLFIVAPEMLGLFGVIVSSPLVIGVNGPPVVEPPVLPPVEPPVLVGGGPPAI